VVDGRDAYSLCETCAARQGIGNQRFTLVKAKSCFVCGGLAARTANLGEEVLRRIRRYQFKTFSIGMILPSGVQDREDQLRSDLRIRGRVTVKSELTTAIAEFVRRRLHKKIDRAHPELTVLVNLEKDTIDLAAKSMFFYGRYTKPRGVSQRRILCERCWGRGCGECESGYARGPSIEKVLGDRFAKLLQSHRIKFTWLGSEDPSSVVFPPGRPFVAEAKSPMRHHLPTELVLRTGMGATRVTGLRRLPGQPSSIPSFTFKTRAYLETEVAFKPKVRELKEIQNSIVRYRNNKGRIVDKRVHRLRVLKARGRKLMVEITLDGGLPVKRFVNGDSVSPSLSEVLRTPMSCQRFDILRVWESEGFEFGKVQGI